MRVNLTCEEPRSKLGHYNEKKVHSHVLGYRSTWCSNTYVLKTIYMYWVYSLKNTELRY